MKKILFAIITVCLLAGCSKEDRVMVSQIEVTDTIYAAVNLKLNLATAKTKMRGVNETFLYDYNVFVFNSSGDIVDRVYQKTNSSISLRVSQSQEYDIYVVANAGEALLINSLEQLLAYEYISPTSDGVSLENGAVVMVGKAEGVTITDGCEIPISLVRRVAQIVIFADTSQLNPDVELTFEQIRVKDAPSKVKLFSSNKIQNTSDILSYTLNAADLFGSGSKCYMYENMQGTLKPGNTLQKEKVLSSGDAGFGKSTYIEIRCHYKSKRYDGTIYYQFYLGKDALTNFDIQGNTKQTVNIYFRGNGSVRENSWRVITTDLTDYAYITFQNSTEYLYPTDSVLVRWGDFVSDDELPMVTSDNTSALRVCAVTASGVWVKALSESDVHLRATLGSNDITCNVNIAYPSVQFAQSVMTVELDKMKYLDVIISSNKPQMPLIEYVLISPDNALDYIVQPYGTFNANVKGKAVTSPYTGLQMRAYFSQYPDFPGDTVRLDVVIATEEGGDHGLPFKPH